MRSRPSAQTTAGSLVCPIVLLTNQKLVCTSPSGKFLIGRFSGTSNNDGDEEISSSDQSNLREHPVFAAHVIFGGKKRQPEIRLLTQATINLF